MEKKYKLDKNTPLGCLTLEQFIEVLREGLISEVSQTKEQPKFLTVDQLAELTGYSKATIYIKNSNKEIPGCIKQGNGKGSRLLFDTEKIYEWIQSRAIKTKEEKLYELDALFNSKRK